MNGNHAAWVRRVIRTLAPSQETSFEPEYAKGTCWFQGVKVASAVEKCESKEGPGVLRDGDRVCKPWIDVALLAKLLKCTLEDVRKAADDAKR